MLRNCFFFGVKKTLISLLMSGYQGQLLYVNVNEELKLQYFSAFGMNFRNGANYISAYFQNTHIVFSKKLCAKGCRRPQAHWAFCPLQRAQLSILLSPELSKTALSLVLWGSGSSSFQYEMEGVQLKAEIFSGSVVWGQHYCTDVVHNASLPHILWTTALSSLNTSHSDRQLPLPNWFIHNQAVHSSGVSYSCDCLF